MFSLPPLFSWAPNVNFALSLAACPFSFIHFIMHCLPLISLLCFASVFCLLLLFCLIFSSLFLCFTCLRIHDTLSPPFAHFFHSMVVFRFQLIDTASLTVACVFLFPSFRCKPCLDTCYRVKWYHIVLFLSSNHSRFAHSFLFAPPLFSSLVLFGNRGVYTVYTRERETSTKALRTTRCIHREAELRI